MVEAKPDPKRFSFVKGDDSWSQPLGIGKVMQAAARSVKVGHGAFTVIRGSHYRHPNLDRQHALIVAKECLKAVSIGAGVVIRDGSENKVFQAKRLETLPYKNPFRDVGGLWPLRIDAGVDYSGNGVVYPLGNAVLTHVGTPSRTLTFGDDMSVYQLLDGPAKGKFVFFAEMYFNMPNLHNGMHVTADTPLYRMDGPIEIGWSDGHGAMAWDLDGTIEGERTVWGQNFSDLLEALDCQPGQILGRPLTMTLPRDWPTDWSGV